MTCPLARTASKRHVYAYVGEAIIRTAHAYTRRAIYRCACGKTKRAPTFDDYARKRLPSEPDA